MAVQIVMDPTGDSRTSRPAGGAGDGLCHAGRSAVELCFGRNHCGDGRQADPVSLRSTGATDRSAPGGARSPHFAATKDEFSWLPDLLAAGMTDYAAIISRFVAEGVIGEMDGVYTSWATRAPKGRPNRRASAYRATPRSKPLSGASLRRHRALAAALRLAGGGKAAGEALNVGDGDAFDGVSCRSERTCWGAIKGKEAGKWVGAKSSARPQLLNNHFH
jgi:hypothetical protein